MAEAPSSTLVRTTNEVTASLHSWLYSAHNNRPLIFKLKMSAAKQWFQSGHRSTSRAAIVLENNKTCRHDGNVKIHSRIPPRGVPNMKFPHRNGGGGNFYKWLPAGARFVFCDAFRALGLNTRRTPHYCVVHTRTTTALRLARQKTNEPRHTSLSVTCTHL